MQRRIIDNYHHAFFVTFSCYHCKKLLHIDKVKGIVVHFLSAQLKHQSGACQGFVILPDHVHAMVRFKQPESLSVIMGQWKRRSSMALKKLFQTKWTAYGAKSDPTGPMWQRKYYVLNVFSPAKTREKRAYMHNNPVAAGLVPRAVYWRFSSAGWHLLKRSDGVNLTAMGQNDLLAFGHRQPVAGATHPPPGGVTQKPGDRQANRKLRWTKNERLIY